MEPEKLTITVSDQDSVSGLLYAAPKKERVGVTIILGHGAGANQLSPFMCLIANGLAERRFDAMTFNFGYMERGRRVPDPKAKLEACYRAVIDAATLHKKLKGNRLVIGGKSMGGRIASQVAAAGENPHNLVGLVLLGYPLHPPGKPEQLRDSHLKDIRVPMLIVQGSRDAFGTSNELRTVIKRLHLPATLHAIEGGDHSMKVPKSLAPQTQIYETVMNTIARWMRLRAS